MLGLSPFIPVAAAFSPAPAFSMGECLISIGSRSDYKFGAMPLEDAIISSTLKFDQHLKDAIAKVDAHSLVRSVVISQDHDCYWGA